MAAFSILKNGLLLLFLSTGIFLKGQSLPITKWAEGDSLEVQQYLENARQKTNPDSIFTYAEKAYTLAQRISFEKGILHAAQILASYHLQADNFANALRYNIQALKLIQANNKPRAIINQLLRVGKIYEKEKLYPNALIYYRQARAIAEKNQLQEQVVVFNGLLGDTHANNNSPDSAFYFYQQNVLFFKEHQMQGVLIKVYQKIAFNFHKTKNYQQSLNYNFKIKSLVERSKDKRQLAIIYNNIGYDYNALQNHDQAIKYFGYVETLNETGNYLDKTTLYTHLGIAWHNNKDLGKALQYLRKAKDVLPKEATKKRSYLDYLISSVYFNASDIYNALRYNSVAEATAKEENDLHLLVDVYKNAADIHEALFEYETALDYNEKHLVLRDSFQLAERLRQEQLLQEQSLLERAEKEIKLLLANQDFQKLTIQQLKLEKEKLKLNTANLSLEFARQQGELVLARQEQELKETNLRNQALESQRAQQALKLTQQSLVTARQNQEITDLQRKEALQQLELKQKEAREKEQAQEIILLHQEQEISQLELEKQADFRRFAYSIGALFFVILCLILGGLLYTRKTNTQLAQQKEVIELEKNKSDRLLLNILPQETANELKEKGTATPMDYELATVLFTDFSGFTRISQNMSSHELLAELNAYFNVFDEIVQQYKLEKIKTIGDSYMCVGGIPKPNQTHALDAIKAAIKMSAFHQNRLKEKQRQGIDYWDMRIGIHSGKVVAGVVGKNKFAYDIWGDTVNIASRMESSSQLGKINISDSTYRLIKNDFDCIYRGEIHVKNRGEIAMYFVNGIKESI